MFLNKLTGWYHPTAPKSTSQEVVFSITFLYGLLVTFADGLHRYFQPGIEYSITGWKRVDNGFAVMLTDSRQLVLDNPDQWTIRCDVVSNSWAGQHCEEFDINKRNAKERRNAIKTGKRAYGFYTTLQREAQPIFMVPTRPARNQPNGVLGFNAELATMHAEIHQPSPAKIDGKEETSIDKHPLLDR